RRSGVHRRRADATTGVERHHRQRSWRYQPAIQHQLHHQPDRDRTVASSPPPTVDSQRPNTDDLRPGGYTAAGANAQSTTPPPPLGARVDAEPSKNDDRLMVSPGALHHPTRPPEVYGERLSQITPPRGGRLWR